MGSRFNPYKRYNGIYIPDGIYQCQLLTPLSKLVYGRLLRYAGKNGRAYPKQETIAEELCVSRSGVIKAIRQLVENDFIEVEKGSRLKHESDSYFFLENEYTGECKKETSECAQSTHREVDKVHTVTIEESQYEESQGEETAKADKRTLLKSKEQWLRDKITDHRGIYKPAMLNDFFLFWTEPNRTETKLRYELEKTWSTKRRLNTWNSRSKDFNKPQTEKPKIKFGTGNFK